MSNLAQSHTLGIINLFLDEASLNIIIYNHVILYYFSYISVRLGLFYAETWRNCVHCTFILTFSVLQLFFSIFLEHGPIVYQLFLNRFICSIYKVLKDATTSGQSRPGNNLSEEIVNVQYQIVFLS